MDRRQWWWNPYKVLDVYPYDSNFPCVGTTAIMSRRRCGCYIDRLKCDTACGKIDEMAKRHPSKVTKYSLLMLAEDILCPGFHHNQKHEVVVDWESRITMYLDNFNRAKARVAELTGEKQSTAVVSHGLETQIGSGILFTQQELLAQQKSNSPDEGLFAKPLGSNPVPNDEIAVENQPSLPTATENIQSDYDIGL